MNREEFMEKITNCHIGRCIYNKRLNLLVIGPFDVVYEDNKWIIYENIEKIGQVGVFMSDTDKELYNTLFELCEEKKKEYVY